VHFQYSPAVIRQALQQLKNLAAYIVVERLGFIRVSRRAETVVELEATYRKFLFPTLPTTEGRAELLARLEGTSTTEALYLLEFLHRSLSVQGDVCEFGVAQGATSALMANELRSNQKRLWLFDSFEGLPKPSSKDVLIDDVFNLGAIEKYEGAMSFGRNHVLSRTKAVRFPMDRVQIVPGFIEKTIHSPHLPGRVCFAYVDFDFYEPIKIALEFLDRVMPIGGHIVVDDYGWFSAGAQAAVDEFLAERPGRYDLTSPVPWAGRFVVLSRV
jgi:O-methyltransferase